MDRPSLSVQNLFSRLDILIIEKKSAVITQLKIYQQVFNLVYVHTSARKKTESYIALATW